MVSDLQSNHPVKKRYPRSLIETCRLDYISGNGTLNDISQRHGVNVFTLNNYSKKEAWQLKRKEREDRNLNQCLGVEPVRVESDPVVLDLRDLGEVYAKFKRSAIEFQESYENAKRLEADISLSSSERVAWGKLKIDYSRRVQELLRIPGMAPIKSTDKVEKNIGPILPIE